MDTFLSLRHAHRFLGSVAALTVAADFLLYGRWPGVGLSIFALLCYLAVRFTAPWRAGRRFELILGLTFATTLVQGAIRTSLSNVIAVCFLLSIATAIRLSDPLTVCLAAPFVALRRWVYGFIFWMPVVSAFTLLARAGARRTWIRWTLRTALVLIPALLAVGPFVWLLAGGNAIFGHVVSVWSDGLIAWLGRLNWPNPGRVAFWFVAGLGAITLLRPDAWYPYDRDWLHDSPRFLPESDPIAARWRTWVILSGLAGLFLAANLIDLRYLWLKTDLPPGISYGSFVHQGVTQLSIAAIGGGLLIALLSRQTPAVSNHPLTRCLQILCASLMIGLIADAARRVVLYVHAYALTLQRLSLFPFLLLVAVGLALLVWKVAADQTLRWLIGTHAIAVGALFFANQFVDFRSIVATYNVNRYLEGNYVGFDAGYLEHLGPSAWPALERLATAHPIARSYLRAALHKPIRPEWQSWQWTEWHLRRHLGSADAAQWVERVVPTH